MNQRTVESCPEAVVDLSEKKPIRVLHVDDELGLLKVAKQCLELQGPFQVDTAGSVEEALNKLKEKEYDAVVSDYRMPGKDGLEFLELLRKNGNTVPFVMFTGKGREEVAVKAWNLGADHYVNKAGDPETVYCELAHCLRSTVGKQAADVQARETAQKLQTIYENAIEGIGYVSPEENFVFVNKAFGAILGCQEDRLVGMNLHRFVNGEGWARIKAETERRRQGEASRYELVFYRTDGTARSVMVSASPLFGSDRSFAGTVGVVLDITERKKTEEELGRFSAAVRASLDGILTGDLNGNISDVNDAALRMYGSTNKGDLIGKNVLEFLVEGDRTRALQDSMESMKTRQGKTIEYSALAKNGTEVPVEITTAFMRDEQGEPVGFVDIVRNVSERKNAEKRLRASLERYRSFIEVTEELGWTTNADGEVVEDIPSFRKFTGQTCEEIRGLGWSKALHPDDLERTTRIWKEAIATKSKYDVEYRLRRHDGVYRHFMSRGVPVFGEDGNIREWVGTCVDITERKDAEKMILESQQNFKALFLGNPEAAAYLTPDFHIVDTNPRFEELFGYSLAEAKGRHINDVIVPKTRMEEAETLDKNAVEGYVYRNTVRKRKDGSLFPVAVSAATIMVEDKLAGCIAMYKDISELKNAEKKLETMNEKLRVIGGLTRHDVRNKLSTITGNIYLNKKKSADLPGVLKSYDEMESACEQIVRIFEFAKDYEMLGVEELTYIDVGDAVQKAVLLFSDLDGVKVVNECHGLTVLADSLLRQLFYNLIDNSLKYGKKVTRMRIHYEGLGKDELRLIYEDDGVGIASAEKPKLFREGYSTGGSTGYGLYLIGKTMEVYGWTIQERGEPGKGARFVMTIPRTNTDGKENFKIA